MMDRSNSTGYIGRGGGYFDAVTTTGLVCESAAIRRNLLTVDCVVVNAREE